MNDFIQKVIARGLANGLTAEQMLANPQAAAAAYIKSEQELNDKIELDAIKYFKDKFNK